MIVGHVRELSPRVTLMLPGDDGLFAVEFVVDTGFEGELALPRSLAARVMTGAPKMRLVLMADRTMRELPVRSAILDWEGQPRPVEILELDGNPLLGMLLLEGSHLHVEALEGGEVVIKAL